MTCLALGSWPNNGARYEFCFVEHNFNPIRKWDGWFLPLMPMSLLHQRHVLPGQSLLELTGFTGNGNFVFLPSLVFFLSFSKLLLFQSARESSSLALSCKSTPPPRPRQIDIAVLWGYTLRSLNFRVLGCWTGWSSHVWAVLLYHLPSQPVVFILPCSLHFSSPASKPLGLI